MTIIKSSLKPCPCPETGVTIGTGSTTHIDYLDGHPAEYGTYDTGDIETFGIDRGNPTEDEELRDLLGIPSLETNITSDLLFKLGSGIRVAPSNFFYLDWKGHRLDCGCLTYSCDGSTGGSEVTSEEGSTIACSILNYTGNDGKIDTNPDRVELISRMKLNDIFPGGDGTIMDNGLISMFELAEVNDFGEFNNYVDEYGVIYSTTWKKLDQSTLEVATTIKDPKVPGQEPVGRVVKTKNGLRVFRIGVITTIFERIKFCNDTVTVVEKTSTQQVAEFQATFGCGDEQDNPFTRLASNSISDSIEMIIGTETVVSDPEDKEFIWEPQVITSSDGSISFSLPAPNGYQP